MRKPIKKKHTLRPDYKYDSLKVAKFINHIMLDGKKDVAKAVVYKALDKIKEEEKTKNPLETFQNALKNVEPMMEVRSRRIGGANYQVPRPVNQNRREFLGMAWLIKAARARKGKPMHIFLAEELSLAAKGEGEAVKRRENTHKMAEANKAFAHFSW